MTSITTSVIQQTREAKSFDLDSSIGGRGLSCKSVPDSAASEPLLQVAALPCLYSHISNEIDVLSVLKNQILSANNRRSAHVLAESVALAARKYGLGNLGFLTLTFAQNITEPREAQRRLNSLITGVIKVRYLDYLGVFERQRSGRIHYHLLVALDRDIRDGFSFEEAQRRIYGSASPFLRAEWAFWRTTAKAYGFGRTELMPVKSSVEAISRYVGKYISKHITSRKLEDKGIRLVRYSRGVRAGTCKFQFLTEGSAQWRQKVALFAKITSVAKKQSIDSIDDLSRVLGSRWAYDYRDFIACLPIDMKHELIDDVYRFFDLRCARRCF